MLRLVAGLVAFFTAVPAFAHHPMGGTTPATLMEGLLSGFGHPILGLDHFAFIVAAGLLAAPRGRWLVLPVAFVIGSFIGSLLHLRGIDLPGGEVLVTGSVLLLGVLLVVQARITDDLFAAILALAGLIHGHALAESIFGAETTPLVAYLGGLAVTQYGIALVAALVWRTLSYRHGALPQFNRFAGAAIVATGTYFLVMTLTAA